jgi:hypothetical protein
VAEQTALIGLAVALAVIVVRYCSNQPLEIWHVLAASIPAVLVTAAMDTELQDR